MQLTHEAAIARLLKNGWKHIDSQDTHKRTLAKYLMLRPGQTEPEWLRGGALKAIVLHCL